RPRRARPLFARPQIVAHSRLDSAPALKDFPPFAIALLLVLAQAMEPVQPVEAPRDSSLRAPLPELTPELVPEGPVLPFADALELAREQSPDLAVALERVQQARNNVQRAWSAVQPTLDA